MKRLNYPATRTSNDSDDYHGTHVPDPYRWLEAPAHTPEVRAWINAQNDLTFSYLNALPEKPLIQNRLTQLWNYPKQSAPFKKNQQYFQFRNSGLQNQSVLHHMTNVHDDGQVLLDPNTLSDKGTRALNQLSISPDGRHLTYAISDSGSDWQTWHIKNVHDHTHHPETLEWSKFSGATWLPDSSGFFYVRYDAPAEGEAFSGVSVAPALCLHKLGTPVTEDEVVFHRPDEPEWGFYARVSDDGQYLIVHVSKGTSPKTLVFYRKLQDDTFIPLVTDWDAAFLFLGNDGERFYFKTDLDANHQRVVMTDVAKHNASTPVTWQTLIPESSNTLEACRLVKDTFICLYLRDASHELLLIKTDGTPAGQVDLPAFASVLELHAERDDDEVFFSVSTFLRPATAYRFDLARQQTHVLSEPELRFDADAYEVTQQFATSKDGTRVPMFVMHRKGLVLNGEHPLVLYGYGGFNVSLTPGFSVSRLAWLELGGVFAIANLRGGGEYGKAWHEAGIKTQKQNVFDDFIACAETLIANKYTRPEKLAIQGGSNGGLLVGACLNQRPDLFGAAHAAVGVMDMLRFHKFTIGWAWVSDYGSADNPEDFETLISYSPLHNIKPKVYPATLITTGDFDDRVVPAHSFKYAAALQHAQQGDAPILIRVQTNTGHGAGKPTSILIEESSDIWAFLAHALHLEVSA